MILNMPICRKEIQTLITSVILKSKQIVEDETLSAGRIWYKIELSYSNKELFKC